MRKRGLYLLILFLGFAGAFLFAWQLGTHHCDASHTVDVEIMADGQVVWAGSMTDHKTLLQHVRDLARLRKQPEIAVRAEPGVSYEKIDAFMRDMMRNGATCIGTTGIVQEN